MALHPQGSDSQSMRSSAGLWGRGTLTLTFWFCASLSDCEALSSCSSLALTICLCLVLAASWWPGNSSSLAHVARIQPTRGHSLGHLCWASTTSALRVCFTFQTHRHGRCPQALLTISMTHARNLLHEAAQAISNLEVPPIPMATPLNISSLASLKPFPSEAALAATPPRLLPACRQNRILLLSH